MNTLSAVLGEIKTFQLPNHPENYLHRLQCWWSVTAPEGLKIKVQLVTFNTEPCCDKLKVYNSAVRTDVSTLLLGEYSGNHTSRFIYSIENYLGLYFASDSSFATSPIQFQYTAVAEVPPVTTTPAPTTTTEFGPEGCASQHVIALVGMTEYVQSPNYPSNYPNHANCWYAFSAPSGYRVKLNFTSFDTEFCCDRIIVSILFVYYLYNSINETSDSEMELGTYRGSQTGTVVYSSTEVLGMRFTSDGSLRRQGFRISFTAVLENEIPETPTSVPETVAPSPCGSEIYLHAIDTDGYLQLPSYPNDYNSNLNCWWTITATAGKRVRLDFVDFLTETCCDFLYVSFVVTFSVNKCIVIYNSEGQTDNSSLLMRQYSGNYNGTVIYSQSEFLSIKFHTDSSVARKGFRIKYTAIGVSDVPPSSTSPPTTGSPTTAPSERCGPHHGYRAVVGLAEEYIQLPTYPNNYSPHLNCWWTVDAPVGKIVRLDIVEFQTEACCDILYVHYASRDENNDNIPLTLDQFSGTITNTTTVYSRSDYLRINFQSDSSVQYRGFRILFSAVDPSEVPTQAPITTTTATTTTTTTTRSIEHCGAESDLQALSTIQYLTSYGYPNNYANSMRNLL
ncbi:dorsal-ventral patterning protein tolloid-like [Ciona intestinalis]